MVKEMEEKIEKIILEKLKDWDKRMLENFVKNMFNEKLSEESVKKIMIKTKKDFDQNGRSINVIKTVFGLSFIFPINNEELAIIPVISPTVVIKAIGHKYAIVYVFSCDKNRKECKWTEIKGDSGYD